MNVSERAELCNQVVLDYCLAINEWEEIQSILSRIERGQFVFDRFLKRVENITQESHFECHKQIFEKYIVPRERGYGSNPGKPNRWGQDGSYFEVDASGIESTTFPKSNRCEVITNWRYMLCRGRTLFVLKKVEDRWLIDGIKIERADEWETSYL